MDFSSILMKWYASNARELPWRNTTDPYRIWVSEVILQQTRVAQGLPYYYRFLERFPSIDVLANAPLDEVMKAWQGLGYYTRARNLHAAARQVMDEFGGVLPRTYAQLLGLKGLGPYSAAAVASFAFGEPVPAVDGNVFRILARLFGIFTPIDSQAARKEFFNLAQELIPQDNPGAFNQAIIDFGALQCTPKSPQCSICPFSEFCYAFQNNLVNSLPIKGKRIIPRDRFFYYFMISHQGDTFIKKRTNRDIWHSLYEFPMVEQSKLLNSEELVKMVSGVELFQGAEAVVLHVSDAIKHKLSHLNIWATFIILEIDKPTYILLSNYIKLPVNQLHNYSLPRLIDSYMAAEPAVQYFIKQKK